MTVPILVTVLIAVGTLIVGALVGFLARRVIAEKSIGKTPRGLLHLHIKSLSYLVIILFFGILSTSIYLVTGSVNKLFFVFCFKKISRTFNLNYHVAKHHGICSNEFRKECKRWIINGSIIELVDIIF